MKLLPYDEFIKQENLSGQEELISNLYEPSDSILMYTIGDRKLMEKARCAASDYEGFIELIRSSLLQFAADTELLGPTSRKSYHLADIISSHPRLGETKNLSVESQNEQKNLQKNQDPPEIQARLKELNDMYEKTYPGLKFIVFVNGRKRQEIINLMEDRINSGNSWFDESKVAINELCDIARDRVKKWKNESSE